MNENQKEIILIEDLGMMYRNERASKKTRYGLFRCYCGNEFKAETQNIKRLKIKSCGCSRKTHGETNHPLYYTWLDMMKRCYNPKKESYKYYGAIGVTVSKEWHNIDNFIKDMYPTYKSDLTLDKDILCRELNINPPIYSKETCVWRTRTSQSRATRRLIITNKSGYRGVFFDKQTNKYKVRISVDKKKKFLGYFIDPKEGALAYDRYITENNLEHTKNFTSLQ